MAPLCFTLHEIAPSRRTFAPVARLTLPPCGQYPQLRLIPGSGLKVAEVKNLIKSPLYVTQNTIEILSI